VGCTCGVGDSETLGSAGCCAVQIMDIDAGEINGVDMSGTRAAAVVDWPGPMMAGQGTGRLYFDTNMSSDQRQAMESVISGKLGGPFSRIPQLVPTILASKVAPITLSTDGDGTAIAVGDYGQAIVKPMQAGHGESLRIEGAGGFRDDIILATGTGSWWRDPDLRQWEGGGYAEQSEINWSD
jgi:hypothetical protein